MPVLELIATVVHGSPGADGMYRTRIADAVVQRHLDVARAHRAILLLNIQPGRAAFLDEVKAWAVSYTHLDVYKRQGEEIATGAHLACCDDRQTHGTDKCDLSLIHI